MPIIVVPIVMYISFRCAIIIFLSGLLDLCIRNIDLCTYMSSTKTTMP